MPVNFHFTNQAITLIQRKKLKQFVLEILEKEKRPPGNLNFIFCSDEYLLDMNIRFLKHNFFTDVITFDLSSSKEETIGEIYISIDRVKDNAKNLNVGTNEELHRVIFHGVLHLSGYKDKTKNDIIKMRKAENKYLNAYFSNVPRITVSP
jgi:rRNA maturation RNase YbeY